MLASIDVVGADGDPEGKGLAVLQIAIHKFLQNWTRSWKKLNSTHVNGERGIYIYSVPPTVNVVGREQDSGSVCQMTVERTAKEEDVNGFLLCRIQKVVLNRSGRGASTVNQLCENRKEDENGKSLQARKNVFRSNVLPCVMLRVLPSPRTSCSVRFHCSTTSS